MTRSEKFVGASIILVVLFLASYTRHMMHVAHANGLEEDTATMLCPTGKPCAVIVVVSGPLTRDSRIRPEFSKDGVLVMRGIINGEPVDGTYRDAIDSTTHEARTLCDATSVQYGQFVGKDWQTFDTFFIDKSEFCSNGSLQY